MSKYDFYQRIDQIEDEKLGTTIIRFITDMVSPDFFKVPASSTGKYHPGYALGEGGLVRHVLAAIFVAEDFLRLNQYKRLNKDYVLAALLLHDCFKYWDVSGNYNYDNFKDHGDSCANILQAYCHDNHYYMPKQVIQGIRRHMGQWDTYKPRTQFEKLISLCDYVASRKYTDFKFTEV